MTDLIPHVRARDPQVAALIDAEERRQSESIRLIASENYASRAVMEALRCRLSDLDRSTLDEFVPEELEEPAGGVEG